MPDTFSVSVRQAELLLLNDAHISLREIQALPFIENDEEALAVTQRLVEILEPRFRVEITSNPWDSEDVRLTLRPN